MHSRGDDAAHEAALEFLLRRIDYERMAHVAYGEGAFKLDRMRELLVRLGQPHLALPIVHVAGTKGKGSTSAMLSAVFSAAGYRTGFFSSPHLDRIEERMQVDGQLCSAAEFVELVARLRPVVDAMDAAAGRRGGGEFGPTYFELTTALALVHFARRGVDVAVLEVGMGGRLDSTNVCLPRISVITSISFDHTRQLGNTLAAIAQEKAGIVKPGVPVVSGVLPDEPRCVIEHVCRERGSRLVQLGRDFDYAYAPPRAIEREASLGRVEFEHRSSVEPWRLAGVELGLLGRHQAANAAVALAVVHELLAEGWRLPEAAIRRGLRGVCWPARVEVVSRQPVVVIDAAHNLASIEALLATLDESFAPGRRWLVFATTKEKDMSGMLRVLLPRFDEVIFTRYRNNPRGVPPEELLALARELGFPDCRVAADASVAWQEVRRGVGPSDLVCVTGSFFIAAEMRAVLRDCPR